MYAIRDDRPSITLKNGRLVGNKFYSTITFSELDPNTLMEIYKILSPEEDDAKTLIMRALFNKKYKQNNTSVYFGPPLQIGNKTITYVGCQASVDTLEMSLKEVGRQNPFDTTAINKLEKIINKKRKKNRKKFYSSLPPRKRLY